MQGADRVNDEFEVGFDAQFERRWLMASRIGTVVMVLVAIAGLAGLLGRGPFSHRTERSDASALSVDFEPIARANASTQVTFHLDNPSEDPTLQLFVSTNVVEPMGLQSAQPPPVDSRVVENGIVYTVAIPPGTKDAKFRLMLMPNGLGANQLEARLAGRPALKWTQFVVP